MVTQPEGPMGWGIPNEPESSWTDAEERTLLELHHIVPSRLMRQPKKEPIDAKLLEKVNQIQQANGIESGFCCLYLTEAIFGHQFAWKRQIIGSCVASGDMRTTSYRMLAEVFLFNDPEQLFGIDITGADALAPFAPYNYRGGRREAGINGRSDGSLCVPHIKGKMKYGHLPCSTRGLQSDDFPEPQSSNTYKTWGADNRLLEQFRSEGAKFVLMESEPVKSAADAKELIIEHKKPLNICSMWSFVPDNKHPSWVTADGQPVYIHRRGSRPWAHNMSVIGFVTVSGKDYVIIENSWGSYHKGRTWFPIPASLFDTWVRNANCQSVGDIDMGDNKPVWPEN